MSPSALSALSLLIIVVFCPLFSRKLTNSLRARETTLRMTPEESESWRLFLTKVTKVH